MKNWRPKNLLCFLRHATICAMQMDASDDCGACQGRLIVAADDLDILREVRTIQAEPFCFGKPFEQVLHELRSDWTAIVIAGARPCMFLTSGDARIGDRSR